VCQQPSTPPDKSCGIGPPTISYLPYGGGVVMKTAGGYSGCTPTVARSVTLNLLCATANAKPDKSVDLVVECKDDLCCLMILLIADCNQIYLASAGCQYTINQYFNAACGSRTPSPSPTPPPSYIPNDEYCCVYSNGTSSQCPCISGGCIDIPGYTLQFSFPTKSCTQSCSPFCASKNAVGGSEESFN
jgi:hypothetical protein